METQLFTNNDYDFLDDCACQFYDVTLIIDIGDFKKGTKFDCAVVNYGTGELKFLNNDGTVIAEYRMELKIV